MARRIVGILLLAALLFSLGYKLQQEWEVISDNALAVVLVMLVLFLLVWGVRQVLRDS